MRNRAPAFFFPITLTLAIAGCSGGSGSAQHEQGVSPAPVVAPAPTSPTPTPAAAPAAEPLPEASMPAWRKGVAVGQWVQVPGTALASAPMAVTTQLSLGYTGPSSKVAAWTGFSIDTRDSSVYSAANGGHYDYAGNEVNRIRLLDDTPTWTEPRASTPASQVVEDAFHYADGRPTSRHSYYGSVFNEVRGRAMILGGSRFGHNGNMTLAMDGFDPAAGDWDAAFTFPNVPSSFGGMQAGAVTTQKSTGDIYTFANWNIDRWNSATNTWSTMLSNTPIYGQYAASALDTRRNRILVVGGNASDHGVYDLVANTAVNVNFTGTAAGAVLGDGNGMVYEPVLDAFLLTTRASGGVVYRINAANFSVDVLATSGGSAMPAPTNGVWGRFLYAPQLKGIVCFPTYDGGFWFLRTY